jgi:hypothetical protein
VQALNPGVVRFLRGLGGQPMNQKIFGRSAIFEAVAAQVDLKSTNPADPLHAGKFGVSLAQRRLADPRFAHVSRFHIVSMPPAAPWCKIDLARGATSGGAPTSGAIEQQAYDNPDPHGRQKSHDGLVRREIPNSVSRLPVGVLYRASRPLGLAACLGSLVTGYGPDGIFDFSPKVAGGTFDPIFVHGSLQL